MSHFTTDHREIRPTPRAWLRVGAQIGELVNDWAGRTDVVAYVGPGAGGEAAACFNPSSAEMEINVDVAFAPGLDPDQIVDMGDRRCQFDWSKATGAIKHEAGHARHSRWSFTTLNEYEKPLVRKLAVLFEESRIEGLMVERYPANRSFLRSCALEIVIKDLKPEEVAESGLFGLSQLILLTLARVDAGVLEPVDVEPIRVQAETILGEELLGRLREVWIAGQAHRDDTAVEPLLELGERWLELMKDAGQDLEAEQDEASAAAQALADALGEMMEALGGMAEATEIAAESEGTEQVRREVVAEALAEQERKHRERADHEKVAEKLFEKTSFAGSWGTTDSTLRSTRKPTDKERSAASTIGRLLEKAKYHDRIVTDRESAVPPGRIRMQAVMQGEIERSRGATPTVLPFKSKVRHHAIDPDIRIGVMVDISGSMSSAMEPMGVTAWLLSEAASRIDAQCCMVYYGQSVFSVLRPGQRLDKVQIYSAPDSTEEFDPAFKAVDGALNLLHGAGARLLVIVSDWQYRSDVRPVAKAWMRRCSEAGVAVLILPYDGGYHTRVVADLPNVEVIAGSLDPVATAATIGDAAVKALEAASR